MANIKSAIKRAKQNTKRRLHNNSRRSMMRTYVKNTLKAIDEGNKETANACYSKAQIVLDKASNAGLIHKNKAARIKSRLVARIKAMAA